MEKSTLPWIEKYRPDNLNGIISLDETILTLKKFINNKCFPNLLLYGPPGTGKTSTILACAKELYGSYVNSMVMELNSSDDRGIEVVRTRIKQFVISKDIFGRNTDLFKLVILDETDALTIDSQAILRKIIEKYSHTTRFCLICNYLQNISPALQSRCTRFRFPPLNLSEMKTKLQKIIEIEKVNINDNALTTIIKHSRGDMRKAINSVQSIHMAYDNITELEVINYMGYVKKDQLEYLLNSLWKDDFNESYQKIIKFKKEYDISLIDLIIDIHDELVNDKNIDDNTLIRILNDLSKLEYNIYSSTSHQIIIAAFVGIFKKLMIK